MREHGAMRRFVIAWPPRPCSRRGSRVVDLVGRISSPPARPPPSRWRSRAPTSTRRSPARAGRRVRQRRPGVELLTGGSIPLALVSADGGDPIAGTARYVPAPGTPNADTPSLTPASEARGVYQLENVTFPNPGLWQAQLSFNAGAQPLDLTASFPVADQPALPGSRRHKR